MRRNYIKSLGYLVVIAASFSAFATDLGAFFKAIEFDDTRAVKRMLVGGLGPDTVNEQGNTALFVAMREGSFKVAAALLETPGLKLDTANLHGETPLMMAALKGHVEWIGKLLDAGAALERDGWTPLHYAAAGPEPRAVQLLLERGAKFDSLSPNGTTPLMMAARYGDEQSVNALLAKGANASIRNERALNAADFAQLGGRESLAARLKALVRD